MKLSKNHPLVGKRKKVIKTNELVLIVAVFVEAGKYKGKNCDLIRVQSIKEGVLTSKLLEKPLLKL